MSEVVKKKGEKNNVKKIHIFKKKTSVRLRTGVTEGGLPKA